MSVDILNPDVGDRRMAHMLLMRDIEDFLYLEADLLDDRQFEPWLAMFSDDLRYWMPIRKNMAFRHRDRDITDDDDVAWIDDDKTTLSKRVAQIMTGIHWAEEPLSRVTHLISNVRLAKGSKAGDAELVVRSHFLVHRNRLETETDFISGRREDLLRCHGDGFLIARRKIIIDQSVLLAKNLTFFF